MHIRMINSREHKVAARSWQVYKAGETYTVDAELGWTFVTEGDAEYLDPASGGATELPADVVQEIMRARDMESAAAFDASRAAPTSPPDEEDEPADAAADSDGLDDMSMPDLRLTAADFGINHVAKSRETLIDLIRVADAKAAAEADANAAAGGAA